MGRTKVHIYGEPATPTLDTASLCRYLRETVPIIEVEARPRLLRLYLAGLAEQEHEAAIKRLGRRFAAAKVRDPSRPRTPFQPLPGEVDYEVRRLGDPSSRTFGLLYDGLELMMIFLGLLPRPELGPDHVHIVFTNQLFGTWDEADRRYHARASIYGFPSIISTSGIVEAPAKPREFYLLKRQYAALGMGDAGVVELEQRFKGRFIDHDDPRLTEVMKGYVMQALAYHLWGDPFCPDPDCRLYNAHWQEEVIQAQVGGGFCAFHQGKLDELKKSALERPPAGKTLA